MALQTISALLILTTLVSASPSQRPSPLVRGTLATTHYQSCPCTVKFSVRSSGASAVDLLVVRRDHLQQQSPTRIPHVSTLAVVSKYSLRNVTRTSTVLHDSHMHALFAPDFDIEESGDFAVIVAPSASAPLQPDFSLSLKPRARVQCDVQLGVEARNLLPRNRALVVQNGRASSREAPMQRIAGGIPVDNSGVERSLMASIVSADGNTMCGGVVISTNQILTAAHCRIDTNARVRVGGLRFDEGEEVAIESVVAHEQWNENEGFKYDIALINVSATLRPPNVVLNNDKERPETSVFGRVVGFGLAGSGDDEQSRSLNFVDIPVRNNKDCEEAYSESNMAIDESLQFCAGFKDGGCGACDGDSGGPILEFNFRSQPVIVGIVSVASGCARADSPGLYTRISGFEDWLNSKNTTATFGSNINSKFASRDSRNRFNTVAIVAVGVILGLIALLGVVLLVIIIRKERKYVRESQNQSDSDDARHAYLLPGMSDHAQTSTVYEG